MTVAWPGVKIGVTLHAPTHICGRCGHLFAFHFFSANGAYQGCLGDPVVRDDDRDDDRVVWLEAGDWECATGCDGGNGFVPSGTVRTEFPQPTDT